MGHIAPSFIGTRMKKIYLSLLFYVNPIFSGSVALSVITEERDQKPQSFVETKSQIPNTITDDKHKKLRHYPLSKESRAERPKSFTTPSLHREVPGEIRFLHPEVSQVVNMATLEEYKLEAMLKRRERCKKGALCIMYTIWATVTTGSLILLLKCNGDI